jgi:hypothetical protein
MIRPPRGLSENRAVPVEVQWNRVSTSLRPRDRRVLLVVVCVSALAIAGGVLSYALRSPGPSNVGCVVVTVPSTMGGAVLRNCDGAARDFCREHADAGNAAEQCRRLGYSLGRRRV